MLRLESKSEDAYVGSKRVMASQHLLSRPPKSPRTDLLAIATRLLSPPLSHTQIHTRARARARTRTVVPMLQANRVFEAQQTLDAVIIW